MTRETVTDNAFFNCCMHILSPDLRLFPRELHPNQRVCVKRVRVDVTPVLEHLESKPLDDMQNETDIEVSEITIKREIASDEEEETAVVDEEELNEEVITIEILLNKQCHSQMPFTFQDTDYQNAYFDNGEDYLDEVVDDDNDNEGPTY